MADTGAQKRQALIDAGVPPTEVQNWENSQRDALMTAGVPTPEIAAYFGDVTPNTKALDGKLMAAYDIPGARIAKNWGEMFEAGFSIGALSEGHLTQNEGRPAVVMPQDAGVLENFIAATGTVLSDFPAMVVGAFGGAPAGPLGVLAGSSALPAAIREIRLDQWQHPDGVKSAEEFWERAGQVTWNVAKETVIGTVGGKVGMVAGDAVEKVAAPIIGKTGGQVTNWAANSLGFATAATVTGAALEGRMPTEADFINAAVQALGMNAAVHVVNGTVRRLSPKGEEFRVNMQDFYVRTGLTPDEVLQALRRDPLLQAEMLAPRDENGNWHTPGLDKVAADLGRIEPVEKPLPVEEPEAPKSVEAAFTAAAEEYQSARKAIEAKINALGETHIGTPERSEFNRLHDEKEALETKWDKENRGEGGWQDRLSSPLPSGTMTPETVPPVHLEIFRGLEETVPPTADRVGPYQINATEAEAYGFDAGQLADPAYNEKVARAILADLNNKFGGNMEDMVVAWSGGAQRARVWVHDGRDFNTLRPEQQRALLAAEEQGAFGDSTKYADADFYNQVEGQGIDTSGMPPREPPAPPRRTEPPADGEEPSMSERFEKSWEFVAKENRGSLLDPVRAMWRWATHIGDTLASETRRQDRRLPRHRNEWNLEDAKRMSWTTRGRFTQLIDQGVVRMTLDENGVPHYDTETGNSIKDANRAIEEDGGNYRDFLAYWRDRHALELEGRGIKSGYTPELLENARILTGDPENRAKYERALAIRNENNNGVIDYYVASGRMSAETGEALKANSSAYLTWARDGFDPKSGTGRSPKLGGKRNPVKTQKGSDRLLAFDFEGAMAASRMAMMMEADATVAARNITDMLVADGMVGDGLMPTIDVDGTRALRAEGDMTPVMLETWVASRDKTGELYVVYRDGKPEVWRAVSPEMVAVLKQAPPEPNHPIYHALKAMTSVLRSGIIADPLFSLRTLTYGQWTSFLQGGPVPYVGLMEGFFTSIHPGLKGIWLEAERNGALTGAATDVELRYNAATGRFDDNFARTQSDRNVFNSFLTDESSRGANYGQILQAQSAYLHNASAVGTYIQGKRKGMSQAKAAMRARRLAMDPAERMADGLLENYSKLMPFTNSIIQDSQVFVRELNPIRDPKNAAVNMVKLLASMTAISLAVVAQQLLLDKDRPEKDKFYNRPQYLRDKYWMPNALGADLKLWSPPSPVTWAFKVVPERIMERAITGNPRAFDGLLESLLGQSAPQTVPTAIMPLIETWANRSIAFNTPIVSRSLENNSGEMRYTANTSETAKAIAKIVGSQNPLGNWNWAPVHIDNWIKQWTGPVPYNVLKTVEGLYNPVKKSTDIADTPVLGVFFVRNWGAGQALDDAYSAYDGWVKAHGDYLDAVKHNDPAELAKFSTEFGKATRFDRGDGVYVSITSAIKAISNGTAVIKAIELLPNPTEETPSQADKVMKNIDNLTEKGLNKAKPAMTPDEKRLAIDALASQIFTVSKALTKGLDKLKR